MPSESVTTFCAEQTGVARRLTAVERNLVERGRTKVTKRRRELVHEGKVGMLVRPVHASIWAVQKVAPVLSLKQ